MGMGLRGVGVMVVAAGCSGASGAIVTAPAPFGLDVLMGTPLLAVPGDGMPVGTVYGHPPSSTPGIPLLTPFGPMGFMPSHERVSPGGPGFSGGFLALPIPGPIAGSDVVPPGGATAIDFFMFPAAGSSHMFEITAIGSVSSLVIVVPVGPGAPTYVGFGALGETLIDISIVKLPFPSPTMTTWGVSDIRVLPAPGSLALLLGACGLGLRRKR